jgi:hypothetical protein
VVHAPRPDFDLSGLDVTGGRPNEAPLPGRGIPGGRQAAGLEKYVHVNGTLAPKSHLEEGQVGGGPGRSSAAVASTVDLELLSEEVPADAAQQPQFRGMRNMDIPHPEGPVIRAALGILRD